MIWSFDRRDVDGMEMGLHERHAYSGYYQKILVIRHSKPYPFVGFDLIAIAISEAWNLSIIVSCFSTK